MKYIKLEERSCRVPVTFLSEITPIPWCTSPIPIPPLHQDDETSEGQNEWMNECLINEGLADDE